MQPDSGRQQQRVCADIRQDDHVIDVEPRHIEGEFFNCLMGRHVGQLVLTAPERLYQRLGAEMEGDASELVEAFVMRGGADPALADKEDFFCHGLPYL